MCRKLYGISKKKKERVSITRQVADVYIYNIRHIIACVDAEDD